MEEIGRAALEGRPLRARVTGHVAIDPAKHLTIDSQRFVEHDFSGKKLDSFCSIGSQFLRCSFRDIHIGDAGWGAGRKQSRYTECCFDGAKFRSIAPGNARFEGCSFRNVRILEFFGVSVEFVDCVFSGHVGKGYLNGTRDHRRFSLFERKTNKIVGNDFSECDLRDFAFRTGIDLNKQKLPSGSRYLYLDDVSAALERATPIIASWNDSETRRLAMILLKTVRMDLDAGQKQQLLRIPDRGQFAAPAERLRQVLVNHGA